jgi:N,N'-diacetyllegionaminate synthase
VATVHGHQPGVGLFHCCSVYPADPHDVRLPNIPFLLRRYPLPVGFSDHTIGDSAALSARRRGALMFEKHVTTDRTQPGPDHSFAMEIPAFGRYVAALKGTAAETDGTEGIFLDPPRREMRNKPLSVKSIITRRALPAGHVLAEEDVYMSRPGTGISPVDLPRVIGRTLIRGVAEDMPLQWDDVGLHA